MTPDATAELVKRLAAEVGFSRVGIAHAGPLPAAWANYTTWLSRGYGGSMAYLQRHAEQRADVRTLLPEARSVICVAVSYHRRGERHAASSPPAPTGRTAMYARGRDYHTVLYEMLHDLDQRLRAATQTPFESRVCVDTAPVLERELARQAGLGWIGKHTLILDRRLGSYLFLGELLTTLEMIADEPVTDHCGTCTRCLDACPTDAFPQPHVLDAARCIAYLTIENRDPTPPAPASENHEWVFGCDICQQVCPYNRQAPDGTQPDIMAHLLPAELDLVKLTQLRSGAYRRLVRDTAARRASRQMWRRNASIVLRNQQTAKSESHGEKDRPHGDSNPGRRREKPVS